MNNELLNYFRYMLVFAAVVCVWFCVDEFAALSSRVRVLENAPPNLPEITITIPDDWVK